MLFVFNIWEQMYYDNIKGVLLYGTVDEPQQKELLEDLKTSARKIKRKMCIKKVFIGLYASTCLIH